MTPSRQILLVDADPDEVQLIREVVESAGLEMHVSADRTSAIEAFRAIAPDLVLIDADAESDGGEAVSRQMRETRQGGSVPIVLIRNSAAATIPGASPKDASEWLLKPLRAQALLGTFARHFPHAFLMQPSTDLASPLAARTGDLGGDTSLAARGQDTITDEFPGFDSLGEEALGELLDSVFPESDSGSLASTLRTIGDAAPASGPANLEAPTVERAAPAPADTPFRAESERTPSMSLLDPPDDIAAGQTLEAPEMPAGTSSHGMGPSDSPSGTPEAPALQFDPPRQIDRHLGTLGDSATLFDPPAREISPPSETLEPSRTLFDTPVRPLDPPSAPADSPERPFEPLPLPVIPPPPQMAETSQVARGDFLPSSLDHVEEVPLLPVLPAADAVGTAGDTAARPRPQRTPEITFISPRTRREKRSSRSWLIALALIGALLAAGSYALVAYWSRDTDLKPVPRSGRAQQVTGAGGAEPVQGTGNPSAAESGPLGHGAGNDAPSQSSAGLDPSLRSRSDEDSAGPAGHVVSVEPPAQRRPHERGRETPSPRRGGAAGGRPGPSSSSNVETGPSPRSPSTGQTLLDPHTRSAVRTSARIGGRLAPPPSTTRAASIAPEAGSLPAMVASRREPHVVPEERPGREPSDSARAPAPAAAADPTPGRGGDDASPHRAEEKEPPGTPPASELSQPAGEGHHSESPPSGAVPSPAGEATKSETGVIGGGVAGGTSDVNSAKTSPAAGARASGSPAPAMMPDRPARQAQPFVLPTTLSHPQPAYPTEARELGVGGTVKLLVRVGDDGSVISVRVVGSVAPALDRAAAAAVRGWKYRPAQFGDRFVAAWIEESVTFKP